MTYQEILAHALTLSTPQRQALVEALQSTLGDAHPLTPLQRLALGSLTAPRASTPDNVSERSDELLQDIIPLDLI